ncbi:hypothetical protein [Canibacter zhoujuaniae]|uniref:hypothetical protein n=1 Tax=Canibacter zhoujuaniae TaxID=2708343 RepID=UPI00141DB5C4|nr:hypothetical protein [Canibacter zhoujuaniae]
MSFKKRALPTIAILASSLLVLSGCGSQNNASSAADLDYDKLPLNQFFNEIYSANDYDADKAYETLVKAEEKIASCMQDQGWDYTPNPPKREDFSDDYSSSDDDLSYDSREYAEKHGYGITEVPGGLNDEDIDGAQQVDPNQDYVNSLSDSERDAYYESLQGPSLTEEQMAAIEAGEASWDDYDQGCYGSIRHDEMSQDPIGALQDDPEIKDLLEKIGELANSEYDKTHADYPFHDLDRELSDCLAKADVGLDNLGDQSAQDILWEEYNELAAASDDSGETSSASPEELEAFKKREREVAVAEWDCKEKIGYHKKHYDITFERQTQFVNENKATLNRVTALVNEKNSKSK